MKNKLFGFATGLFIFLILAFSINENVFASGELDEIEQYTIKVDVNDDATLNIYYHIDWRVLDSDSEGPLEWVKVGIPNSHYISYQALSDNIRDISTMSSGGYYVRIDFDRKYYEGEVVSFDFMVVQDYMYQVDKLEEGYTVYEFTPGWFDDLVVDDLNIYWEMDKSTAFTPSCSMEDGYYHWNALLLKGDKYTVSVTYPNDAYGFNLEHQSDDGKTSVTDIIAVVVGLIVVLVGMLMPFMFVIVIIVAIGRYYGGANFGGAANKKITRTKVTYYPSCPGCGAVRKDKEQFCTYCGRSFVKSEEIIKEEDIKPEDKDALKFKIDGEYRYTSMPNTYIRVHTVSIPRPAVPVSRSSGRSGGHHSSCAHSSCACACACACAGGGRAGCSTKDFYNTNLKMRQLEALKCQKKQ